MDPSAELGEELMAAVSDKTPLLNGIAGLHKSSQFSDLVLSLGTRSWNVHKAIVCARSDLLFLFCTGEFKVRPGLVMDSHSDADNSAQEQAEANMTLHNDDPEAIDAMLGYFYTCDYSDVNESTSACVLNLRMFALAEKYLVNQLGPLAAKKFTAAAEKDWASDDFANAIQEAYTNTGDTNQLLLGVINDVVTKHVKKLFGREDQVSRFTEVFNTTPAFRASVAGRLARSLAEAEASNERQAESLAKAEAGQKYYIGCDDYDCQDDSFSGMGVGDTMMIDICVGRLWVTRLKPE
ncbi:hypothetical protein LTR08_009107 [Meristemomyces frigidus]|nr:hypothetical protein LTR08_009107 [Meristemomyces frigidus]